MGSDEESESVESEEEVFQSTPPAWGATANVSTRDGKERFQSTLPAWGATTEVRENWPVKIISIHAPRMGSDFRRNNIKLRLQKFQSTLPAWGATITLFNVNSTFSISIHAPRMGSDIY